ncbi:DUF106 domain-containing protein [Candidatus Woesearchaeota archaeon]|nr:MAG: DUF106 domain-containing protein [Candidatus Woesearchaeota archaeon]
MASGLLNWFAKIFNPILDPVLKPLLNLPPFWTVFIITAIITFITTLIYKKTTNQEELRKVKEDMKKLQNEMKQEKDPKKVMALQKKSWDMMGRQFKGSMRPMLFTTIPLLIIFSWLATNIAYEPIMPGQEFNVTVRLARGSEGNITLMVPEGITLLDDETKTIKEKEVVWRLKGEKGKYSLVFNYDNNLFKQEVLITDGKEYLEPLQYVNKDGVASIRVSNKKIRIFGLTWIWAYLIMAVVLSSALRKVMKVY